MAINYPASLDVLTNPGSSDPMNSITVPHAEQHSNANDAIEALESKLGIDNSLDNTSIDFLVKNSSSLNPGHGHSRLRFSDNTGTSLTADASGNLRTEGLFSFGATGLLPKAFLHHQHSSVHSLEYSWGASGIALAVDSVTYRDSFSSGTLDHCVISAFQRSTVRANNPTTYVDGATLFIAGTPISGPNVSFTNAYSLLVNSGQSRFGGALIVASGIVASSLSVNSLVAPSITTTTLVATSISSNLVTASSGAYSSLDSTSITTSSLSIPTLTNTRVVFASGGGRLVDSSNFTYDSNGRLGVATTGSNAGVLIGADAHIYRDAADVLRTPDSWRIDGSIGIGTTAPTVLALDIAKTWTGGSWVTARDTLTFSANVSGGLSIAGCQHILNINAGVNSGPSNFVTGEVASVNVAGATAYMHYAAGGEFSVKTTASRTGGTVNSIIAGLFQSWLEGSNGTFSTFAGGRFDAIATNATASGVVSDGAAAIFRFGPFNQGSPIAWSTLAGLNLIGYVGSGAITNWYGINGQNLTVAGTAVTSARWISLGTMMPFTAANQTRIGLDITAIPSGTGFSGTTAAAIRIGASTLAKDAILWGSDVNLYRSAASALRTDTEFVAGRRITSGVVTLTDSASISTDASLGNHFRVTLAGNRTLSNPTNAVDGQRISFEFIQDSGGGRTLNYGTKFGFGTDISSATLSTSGLKRDFLTCIYNSVSDIFYVVDFVRGY